MNQLHSKPTISYLIKYLLIWAVIVPIRPVAQLLSGYIVEQNSNKRPVPAVLLKALSANQVASGSNGQYKLQFQDGRPGKSVFLSVEKEDWKVTNEADLDVNLPADPLNHPHSIVMCPQAVWNQRQTKFRDAAQHFLEKSFAQKLNALQKKNTDTKDSIARLYEQLAVQQKAMEALADAMTSVNMDEVSEKERQAYQLFQEGKIEECIRLRESMNSEENLKKARQKKQVLDKLIQSLDSASAINREEMNVYRRNIREEARLAMFQFDIPAASAKLAFLANEDSTEFKSLYDYAEFLQQQKQPEKAIGYGQKALQHATTDIQRCKVQNTLSILYRAVNNFAAAHQALQEVAAVTKILTDSFTVYTASYVAITQNNLGLLYKDENNYTAAAKAFRTALQIRQRQAAANRSLFEPCVASALTNLGNLYNDNTDYASAEKTYQEVAAIYQQLLRSDNDTYEPLIATVQNNLGLAYFYQGKYAAADSAFVASIRISRRLALRNPDAYLPDIAETDVHLATLYRTIQDYAIADSALQEALQIRTTLAAHQPTAYQSGIAEVKMNIGLLYWAKASYTAAETELAEAQKIYRQLAQNNPATYLPVLAGLHNNLGGLYTSKKDTVAATEAYNAALSLYRQLADNYPAIYKPVLATTLYKMAVANRNKADYAAARPLLIESLAMYRQLSKDSAINYTGNISLVQNELATIYLKTKDTTAAIAIYKEMIQLRNADSEGAEIADLRLRLGRLYRASNPVAAEEAFSQAATTYSTLVAATPNQYEASFCRAVANLGELYLVYYQPQKLTGYAQLLAAAGAAVPRCTDSAINNRIVRLIKMYGDDCLEIKMLQAQLKRTTDLGKKLRYQQQVVAKRRTLVEGGKETYRADLAKDLTNLCWYLLLNSQFDAAEETARQLLAPPFADAARGTDNIQAKEYLAAALLLQDKWTEAEKIYKACKDLTYTVAGKTITGSVASLLLKDLDELEKAGIQHENISKVRLLLNDKGSTAQEN